MRYKYFVSYESRTSVKNPGLNTAILITNRFISSEDHLNKIADFCMKKEEKRGVIVSSIKVLAFCLLQKYEFYESDSPIKTWRKEQMRLDKLLNTVDGKHTPLNKIQDRIVTINEVVSQDDTEMDELDEPPFYYVDDDYPDVEDIDLDELLKD
jgi:hypothetical protein